MSNKVLYSTISKEEGHFFIEGFPGDGGSNIITEILQLIGYYFSKGGEGIEVYHPETEPLFRYENEGIKLIRDLMGVYYPDMEISRKNIVWLSHTFIASSVKLDRNSDTILDMMFEYINANAPLKAAVEDLFQRRITDEKNKNLDTVMPIQSEFLYTRFLDKGKDYIRARDLKSEMNGKLKKIN